MRIEKLELIGFKSFADKTAFILHPGITCIVGPNGCGKSNIVDAFRWVLGEQSAKSLRGEKMEEVIFNGSLTKKPKGMAEVTLSIAGMNVGGDGNGDGQQDSMTVTRRLYRSGESEYMLNKTPCRLKDIKDIFLDTGLEVKSYSILEQGRIGEILNSKPVDRRFIIEEVAGVMKYKVRRAEALSKLESSRLNIVRITDIIAEVKKQINILDRLAKKAERYKKLSSEMHAIELKIARKDFQQIKEAYDGLLDEYSTLKEKEAVMSAEINSIENKNETRRVTLLEKEKSLEVVQNNFQSLEHEIAEIERSIAVCRNDIDNIAEYLNKLVQQQEEVEVRITDITARNNELSINSQKINDEMEAQVETLKEKTGNLSSIDEELLAKEDLIEDKRREIFRITENISGQRNDLSRQQTSLESLERRETTALRDSEDSRKILFEIEQSISNIESGIQGSNNEALALKEKKEVISQELSDSKARLEKLKGSLSEIREEFASNLSRLDSLREIVFDRPSRELISANSSVRLLASISDVFDADAEYEKAIEAALSEKADSLIMGSSEDISIAVSSLKGKDIGKTSFITIAPPQVSINNNFPEGIIGRALDFVKVNEEFSKIAENLLGNVLIVKDLKTALNLATSDGNHVFVTIEGEVVEPSGVVTAGEGKGILRKKREMRELEEVIEKNKADIEKNNNDILGLQNIILEKEEAVKGVESAMYNIEKELSLSKLNIENHMDDKERVSRKLAYLTMEIEELSKEKSSLNTTISTTEVQIQSIESGKTTVENEMLLLQEGIAQKKSVLEQYRSEVTDIRLEITSGREKLEAIKNEIETLNKTLEELNNKKEELRIEKESVLSKRTRRETEILEHETNLRKLVTDADLLRLEISNKKEEIEIENQDLLSITQGLKSLRHQASEVTSRISEIDVMKAEHKMRLENLAENVKNNYGTLIEELELLEVSSEEEEKLAELREKIQEMGAVNLGTIEEYEELRTRYEFMTGQQEDLNKSIAELEEAITKINSTTRKKLRDAFEALKVKFSEVFVTLFGGGKAELILTDESNILEAGIDIVAQPPGKKLQSLQLLSGGEKALAALALQFASFLIKPTPLCILDEADAPLDESNTERYSRMLAELSKETQFVVVTHNKTTMNIAQHLYGTTMEEAGVSKVISMQLAEVT